MDTGDARNRRQLQLKLDVNEANIDELERQSCEEILRGREREYQDSYRHTPALDELAARYGDTTNRRVYMMSRDVEGRWLDLHRAPERRSSRSSITRTISIIDQSLWVTPAAIAGVIRKL